MREIVKKVLAEVIHSGLDRTQSDLGPDIYDKMADAMLSLLTPKKMVDNSAVDETLKTRGDRYGDFSNNAEICQRLKAIWHQSPAYTKLVKQMDAQEVTAKDATLVAEGVDTILAKLARIFNGDPFYADNWHDIQGYAKLVEDRLPK